MATPSQTERAGARRIAAAAAASFAAALAAYLPALRNPFVNWDDDLYVTDNPHVRGLGADLLRYAFLETGAANWHPLTWLSHAADWALWGPDPFGHHLTSVVLHAVNSGLVALLAAALVRQALPRGGGSRAPERAAWVTATVAGLLFALHPLHVESVAWVAERKDVLCACFFLLSLLAWLRHARARAAAPPGSPWIDRGWAASFGLYALALLAKPMAVSLPAVLLALELHPFRRLRDPARRREVLAAVAPYVLLAAAVAAIAVRAQRTGGAVVTVGAAGISTRLLVACDALATYAAKLLAPVDLLPFYPHPVEVSLASPRHLAAAAAVLLVTVAAAVRARRAPHLAVAWLAYLAMLAPVLGLVQVGGQAMADRYMYLPSVVPFVLAGAGVAWALERTGRAGRALVAGACLAAAGALAALTIGQIGIWRSSVALWTHVIEREPAAVPLAYYNRAQALLAEGLLDRAVSDYSAAFALNPRYRDAVYNRGIVLERKGDLAAAIADYQEAIRLDPGEPRAHNNLGVALARAGDLPRAIESLGNALAVSPGFAEARLNRGLALAQAGRLGEAAVELERACGQGMPDACRLLGQLRASALRDGARR